MGYPKQMKDIVYTLLQEPTLDNFRKFLQEETGEHNAIDFKQEWIEDSKLAKLMLSLANYGGGVIVFGVHENSDNTFSCDGLSALKAKEKVAAGIKGFISSNLKYEIYDFSYQSAEYAALQNKHFQILVIENTPEFLPFISHKEGNDIKPNTIYIRRGTSCEHANEEELAEMIKRRINHIYPNNGSPLDLEEHLSQLKDLYGGIDPTTKQPNSSIINSLSAIGNVFKSVFGSYEEIPNPAYPEESYDDFVARMILEKKKKIERILDLH